MKLITYCILLFVVIGLVPIASADGPIHSLSGVHDETVTASFVYGGDVKDVVTPVLEEGYKMGFNWYEPSGDRRRRADVYLDDASFYIDVLTNTDEQGTWSVKATELDEDYVLSQSTKTFVVAQLPEFSFGSFISLAFAGVLYFLMRRMVKGSVNNVA